MIDQLLLSKGIISQSSDICQDKINLISRVITFPLLETPFTFSGNDA